MRAVGRLPLPAFSLEVAGWLVAGAAWALLILGWALGWSSVVDHHHLLGSRHRAGAGDLVAFLAAWQLMVVAMMLPTALPLIQLFAKANRRQRAATPALIVFVAAYFVVWTAFAVAALVGDLMLHSVVERVAVVARNAWVIESAVLLGAGAFQFSALKHRCLDACRNPLHFLWRYYERGVGGAWRLGVRHGAFCLGCCWALMLVMFAVGVGSMVWMVALAGVMLLEKTSPIGRRVVPWVGAALIAYGAGILVAHVIG